MGYFRRTFEIAHHWHAARAHTRHFAHTRSYRPLPSGYLSPLFVNKQRRTFAGTAHVLRRAHEKRHTPIDEDWQ